METAYSSLGCCKLSVAGGQVAENGMTNGFTNIPTATGSTYDFQLEKIAIEKYNECLAKEQSLESQRIQRETERKEEAMKKEAESKSTIKNWVDSGSSAFMKLMKKDKKPEETQNAGNQQWACAACTFRNDASSQDCSICGTKRELPVAAKWACPSCSYQNKATASSCELCMGAKP